MFNEGDPLVGGRWLGAAANAATGIIETHSDALVKIAEALLVRETARFYSVEGLLPSAWGGHRWRHSLSLLRKPEMESHRCYGSKLGVSPTRRASLFGPRALPPPQTT